MEILLTVWWMIVCTVIVLRSPLFRLNGLPVAARWLAWVIHVLGAFALYAVYTWYYTDKDLSDTWKYFNDAREIGNLWTSDRSLFWRFAFGWDLDTPVAREVIDRLHGWSNPSTYGLAHDSPSIIRVHLLFLPLSQGHYLPQAVFYALMSVLAGSLFFRFSERVFGLDPRLNFVAAMCLPSVVFWASGMMKETPHLLALSASWLALVRLRERPSDLGAWIIFICSASLLYWLKSYVWWCLLPAWCWIALMAIVRPTHALRWVVPALAAGVAMVLVLSAIYPAGELLYVIAKKREDFYHVAASYGAGSVVAIPSSSSWWEFILHMPQACVLTWFRPFPWEAGNPMMLAAALENVAYLVILLVAIARWKFVQGRQQEWWIAICAYVVSCSVIIGSTVPVLGAAVRYRVSLLPFLVVLLLVVTRPWWRGIAWWRGSVDGSQQGD